MLPIVSANLLVLLAGQSFDIAAIVAVVVLFTALWFAWLVPALWRSDRFGLAVCGLLLFAFGLFLLSLLASNWLNSPPVASAVEAASAGVQALLAVGLLAFTGYSVVLSRRTFDAYRRERLDSTLPVLLIQVDSHKIDISKAQVVLKVHNGGVGPALQIATTWAATSEFTMTRPSVNALAPGSGFLLESSGRGFAMYFHEFPGWQSPPQTYDSTSDETTVHLGKLTVSYRDLHDRELQSRVELAFVFTSLQPQERDEEGVTISRSFERARVDLVNAEVKLPLDQF